MSIAILGGIKSLEREYKKLLKKHSIKCKVFNRYVPEFTKKIKQVDAIILCTGAVSHKLAKEGSKVCRKRDIKILHANSGSLTNLENIIVDFKASACTNCGDCLK